AAAPCTLACSAGATPCTLAGTRSTASTTSLCCTRSLSAAVSASGGAADSITDRGTQSSAAQARPGIVDAAARGANAPRRAVAPVAPAGRAARRPARAGGKGSVGGRATVTTCAAVP
ncbi:MAG: hypothetical protein ABIP55_07285, partial [Tepidisphaeraceae bacterium]